jgi:hypothetical protein
MLDEIKRTVQSPCFWSGCRRGVIDALALIGFGACIAFTYLCWNGVL